MRVFGSSGLWLVCVRCFLLCFIAKVFARLFPDFSCLVFRSFQRISQPLERGGSTAAQVQEPSPLSHEEEVRLAGLGMVWKILKYPDERAERKSWEERLLEFVDFKSTNGHGHTPGLGNWVSNRAVTFPASGLVLVLVFIP